MPHKTTLQIVNLDQNISPPPCSPLWVVPIWQGAPLGSDCCFIIFACKTWKNHHYLHNYPNSFVYYYHNHYQNNIHYHQHIFNVKTGLPMWYNLFLKGFLSSVYHSNNNCHNYHYDYDYFLYYHPTCPNIHQNINYYIQINI